MRKGGGARRISVRNGELTVGYGKVTWGLRKPADRAGAAAQAGEAQRVAGPGQYRIFDPPAPGLDIAAACAGPWPGGNAACFDTAKLKWPLSMRTLRPGDRMAPRGGRGTRKLSDLLIDAKIPRQERASLPVLCDAAGAILYVPGLRPSQIGRPDGDTQEWSEIHVLR
jgi:tRNA(Ile)-lysidine synthase